MPRTNMYKLAIKRWNPFRGCEHECRYCVPSFQSWYRRFWRQCWKPNKEEKGCEKCRDWIPHEHPEDLTKRLPKTGFMQFIFTVASGDISSCPTEYFKRIINRIKQEPDKTFLIQSKNPETFGRVSFPDNVILGTTKLTGISCTR